MVTIQAVGILFESIWQTLNMIASFVIGLLPEFLQLNKLAAIFSPVGSLFVLTGVPLVLVPIAVKMVKRIKSKLAN